MTLSIAGLTFQVGSATLVDHAAFEVPAGSVVALVGPNGAGKSTLLRMVSGAVPSAHPDVAEVSLHGENLLRLSRRDRARRIALVEQQSRTEFAVTVEQVVALGRLPHRGWWAAGGTDDGDVVAAAMERAGVSAWAGRELGTLSGGEQQRVQVARALAQQPQLLLLDEPTNHLDVAAQLEMFALLRRLADVDGMTILVALHDLSAAAADGDHAVVMDAGRVVTVGPVDQALDPSVLEDIYGVRVDVLMHPRTQRPVIVFSARPAEAATRRP